MKNLLSLLFKFIKPLFNFVMMIVIAALILGLPVMLLWNATIPDIFGLKEITFYQAIGLNLLSLFLIKQTNINPFNNKN